MGFWMVQLVTLVLAVGVKVHFTFLFLLIILFWSRLKLLFYKFGISSAGVNRLKSHSLIPRGQNSIFTVSLKVLFNVLKPLSANNKGSISSERDMIIKVLDRCLNISK